MKSFAGFCGSDEEPQVRKLLFKQSSGCQGKASH